MRGVAQEGIHHLQHLLDDHGCSHTLSAIISAAEIAEAQNCLSHKLRTPAEQDAGRAAALKLVDKLQPFKTGVSLDVAFSAFVAIAIGLAVQFLDAETAESTDDGDANQNANRNEENQSGVAQPLDIQALTKKWIAKSNDPNSTPEEREQAKKLVEDYGIGDTGLVQ
jgi:hypothetical protein